jgi:hypothetical protein
MPSESQLLQIEVALRDSRHTDVIMSLDRLVLLPETREEMQQAMEDLKKVKAFIDHRLPKEHLGVAQTVFVLHGKTMKEHFLAAHNKVEK